MTKQGVKTASIVYSDNISDKVCGATRIVALLAGAHGYFGQLLKGFTADKKQTQRETLSHRISNEAPTILMLVIVFLVVLKGF